MDLKFKDYVLVNSANSKKLNMAVDQLADADKTELRIKQTTGCPIILFKQSQNQKLGSYPCSHPWMA